MQKTILLIGALAIAVAIAVISCTDSSEKNKSESTPTNEELIKRGEYLVSVIGCDDCHSPKKMGNHGPEIIPELRLSGFNSNLRVPPVDTSVVNKGWIMLSPDLTSAVGPWGMSFAANLTSDPTGIGNWSEENFFTAIRKGKSKGIESNRDLLPPMPWFIYKNMTDADLRSVYAYLKTVAPVNNVVPAPQAFDKLK